MQNPGISLFREKKMLYLIAEFQRLNKAKMTNCNTGAQKLRKVIYKGRSSRRELMSRINNFIKFNRIYAFKSTETIRFNGKLFRHLHFWERKSSNFSWITCILIHSLQAEPKTFLYFRCNSNHLTISDNHYASLPLPVDFFITPIPGRWL